MKIPQKFMLGAQTYIVTKDEELVTENGALGLITYATNRIQLQANMKEDKAGHSFCHELLHGILDALSHPLYDDEVFVDSVALLLHQALVTGEGELKFKKVSDVK